MRDGPLLQSQFVRTQFAPHIQGLRAIAVLTVLIHHVDPAYLPGGFLGVDIFFVISGFLITSHIEKGRTQGTFTLSGFYFRRIRRILPNQLVVIAAVSIAAYFLFDRESFEITAASAAYSAGLAANVFFLENSGYFSPASETMPLLHMWSLAVEEQFYLIWPATILGLATVKGRARSFLMVGGTLALLFVTEWMVDAEPTAAFYLTPFRIIEFLCGGALAFWWPEPKKSTNALALAALGVIAACLALYSESTPFPGLTAIVPCAATAALIVWGDRGLVARLLNNPVAVAIGDRSYALYLIHWPVIVFVSLSYPLLSAPSRIAVVLLVTAAATEALYRLWEKPLRYVSLPTALHRRVYGAGVAGALVALVAGAAFVGQTHLISDERGMANRNPRLTGCLNADATSVGNCETDILVIGDSHAGVVANAVEAASRRASARSAFMGCPPLFDVVRFYTQPENRWKTSVCANLRETWQKELPYAPAKTIVLAARWAWLTEPGEYGGGQVREDYLLRDTSQEPSVERSRAALRESLDETVGALIAAGKTVVLVGQAPLRTNAEVACAKANADQPDVNETCRVVSKDEALARLDFANQTIRDLGEKYLALRVFIPSDELCADECDLVRDGVALYKDSNHLHREGAALVGRKALGPLLAPD
ncbi:MAG: acyltransferase family protein [Pseudomonadota bacterium]